MGLVGEARLLASIPVDGSGLDTAMVILSATEKGPTMRLPERLLVAHLLF